MTAPITTPAFGAAVDLTNCDREPIHRLGMIQPFGVLLAVTPDWTVAHASDNADRLLHEPAAAILGRPLDTVFSRAAIHTLRGRMQFFVLGHSVERVFGVTLREDLQPCDVAIHMSGDLVIIELEASDLDDRLESTAALRAMVNQLDVIGSLGDFCGTAARQMRGLVGFDRVMVYRFDHDGAGEVIGESVRRGLGSFLNHRFPASDIPAQARELYRRNWLRIIADVNAEGVPVRAVAGTDDGPLDLSMSVLRSVSPIHIEYLRNMGVGASMSVSILRHGQLWGLIACHHMRPFPVAYERRSAAELFGQIFSLLLEHRERQAELEYEARARHVHTKLMSTMAAERSGFDAIGDHLDELRDLVDCDGVAVSIDGIVRLSHATPPADAIADLVGFIDDRPDRLVFATHEIGRHYPAGAAFVERAAGVLAVPISRASRDYLLFFRKEVARTFTWAGDPSKPVELGPNGARLTPRKSFEAWRETVRGQSKPWTDVELGIAEAVRISVLEIILRMTDQAESERRTAHQRQELLIAELNHRVRNILGLIRGLVTQSRAGARTVEAFASVLGDRVESLARAHDQITRDNWGPAPLRHLIKAEAEAYLTDKASRVTLDGPPVLLSPEAFSTLALVFHELTTNSAKYGAMCDSSGRVDVVWTFDPDDGLTIVWTEQGGPPVKPPSRRGFGSTIIERSVPYDLQGSAEIRFAVTGLTARFVIPASYCELGPDENGASAPPLRPRQGRLPRPPLAGHVLLVEDNMMIALDAEDMLAELGAQKVHLAPDVAGALLLIAEEAPSFALLDVHLGRETSLPVATMLRERGIPFVFATGYGEEITLPDHLKDAPVVTKPYTADTIRARLGPRRAQGSR